MKPKISLAIFTLFLLLSFGSIGQVLATSCVASLPCEDYQRHQIVFLGKVVKKTRIDQEFNKYLFEVIEEYKNPEARRTIEIYAPAIETLFGIEFTVGKKYLIFASKTSSSKYKGFFTGLCSGIRLISDASESEILSKFRNYSITGMPTSIRGGLYRANSNFDSDLSLVGGIRINAVNLENNNTEYSTYTEKNGSYSLEVTEGKYILKPDLPTGYKTFSDENEQKFANAKKNQCVVSNLKFGNDSKISGKVTDIEGNTLDKVRVKLNKIDNDPEEVKDTQTQSSKNGGNFLFKSMPKGEYKLNVELPFNQETGESETIIYYKQSVSPETAEILIIDEGKKIENVIFKLPFLLPNVKIKGTILNKNKKPYSKAWITLKDAKSEYFFEPYGTANDKAGNFEITGFIGRKYELVVGYKEGNAYKYIKKEFVLKETTKPFVIVLPIE